MSRLASFRAPSTPTSSPVQHRPPNGPTSPARQVESTYHRKTRTYLLEIRSIADTWDALILVDGLKAARILVDTRTDLENALVLTRNREPRTRLVGPKIAQIDKCLEDLETVIAKLQKLFRRMVAIDEAMEVIIAEAHSMKGWKWVHEDPLWVSWPLEKFVTSVHDILIPYHRSFDFHTKLVNRLSSHSLSFEDARDVIAKWVEQPCLEDAGWKSSWEAICSVEVEGWDKK